MSLARRDFLFGSLAAPAWAAKKKPIERPNVVLVMTSDLGAWSLGSYGNREIRTPHLDEVAALGVRFENSFVYTPEPLASRRSFFTGRLPKPGPPVPNETTLSELLAAQGYTCGFVGNWDMGVDGPAQHRYTSWQSHSDQGAADSLTADAGRFLEQQAAGKPFLLTVSYPLPRLPYTGLPQKYYDQYAAARFDSIGWQPASAAAAENRELLKDPPGSIRKYAAAVSALDDQIGSLLARLQQRALRENTLVVFYSDSGELAGRHGLWGQGSASNPVNLYDEAVRVPMLWVWPGRIPPQSARPEMISSYDLLPSLCEATGVPPPEDRPLPGHSYLPLALSQPLPKKQPWRNLVYGRDRNTEMVRDTRFKLVLRDNGKGPNAFYALATDPRENVNQYENPQFVSARDHLATELEAWRQKLS